MEEEFPGNNDKNQEARQSVERYEEMLRKKDAYFFDVDAFLQIIENYIEKNDPVKALEVVTFAQ